MGTHLTDTVLEFQKTGTGFERVLSEISLRVYRYPWRKYGWEEDDCSDFFLVFYRRLPGLVQRFRDTGYSFETYLYSTMKWQMRTFIQKKKQAGLQKKILETECFLFGALIDPSSDRTTEVYESPDAFPLSLPLSRSMRRRLLFLTLMGFSTLNEEKLDRISCLIDIPVDDLARYISTLRSGMQPKLDRIQALRERRNRVFFRIRCLEEEICSERLDEELIMEKRYRLRIEQKRMSDLQKEISRIPLYPTHKEIADVLGVPKGTVDSGLFYLKTRFSSLYHDGDIRYA